jgi:hypothetical protein
MLILLVCNAKQIISHFNLTFIDDFALFDHFCKLRNDRNFESIHIYHCPMRTFFLLKLHCPLRVFQMCIYWRISILLSYLLIVKFLKSIFSFNHLMIFRKPDYVAFLNIPNISWLKLSHFLLTKRLLIVKISDFLWIAFSLMKLLQECLANKFS